MKLSPKMLVWLPIVVLVFDGLRVALEALDGYLKSGQKGWVGAAVVTVTALAAWMVKAPWHFSESQVDERVEERLRSIATPPDDSTEF